MMRASLPMYDLPELRAATDVWWAGMARALRRQGFADAPDRLERSEPHALSWRAPDLLLSQCCGRDLVTHLAGVVAPVALPCYRAAGCSPGQYRSWLIVRRDDLRRELAAFAGAVAAVNYTGSHSGWVALAHSLARARLRERFFAHGRLTGSHRASLAAVAGGQADIAAIDCVTYALLERAEPTLAGSVRVLTASEPAPALPYVTALDRPAEERQRLLAALLDAATDPSLVEAREALLIDSFVPVTVEEPFARMVAMAEAALREPCAVLA